MVEADAHLRSGNITLGKLSSGSPLDTGANRTIKKFFVQQAHSADAKLIMSTMQLKLATPRRIQRDVAHRRPKTFVGQWKVLQGASHENPSRMYRVGQCRLSIDQQHVKITLGKQPRHLQA